MNLDLNELDLGNVARWPAAARAVVIIFIMGGVIFLGYWFHTKDQLVELEKVEQHETDLKVIFEKKAQQAANLEAYELQLEEMRESFGAMLRQLPNKTEVADLLVDVSQTGLPSASFSTTCGSRATRPRSASARSCGSASGSASPAAALAAAVAALAAV